MSMETSACSRVCAGEDALAAVEDLVVGGVSLLDDLQSAVDLAVKVLISEIVAGEDGPDRPPEFFGFRNSRP
ncbi:hypothetical protein PV341_01945 [Streptomyces sp. PA03-1a]|nr:hypothetical protein [Streptomyces sp. PA03-1a]